MAVSCLLVLATALVINGYPLSNTIDDSNKQEIGHFSSFSASAQVNNYNGDVDRADGFRVYDYKMKNDKVEGRNEEILDEYNINADLTTDAFQQDRKYQEPIFHNDRHTKAGKPTYTPVLILTNDEELADVNDLDLFAGMSSVVGKHDFGIVDLKKDTIFNAIGQFEGRLVCTGTFIAPRTVLTAAHCINSGEGNTGSRPPSTFHRQKGCGSSDGVVHNVLRTIVFREWIDTGNHANDIALIMVDEPSDSVIDFGVLSDKAMHNLQENKSESEIPVSVLGYSPEIDADGCLVKNPGFILEASKYIVYYDCDTAAGMNGGPIYDSTSRKVYGVHTDGFDSSSEIQLNAGVAMTKTLESIIRELIKNYENTKI